MQSLPHVQIAAGGFTFTAELPSFFTQLAINAERDRLVSQVIKDNCALNKVEYSPDMINNQSNATLNFALLMANFTQTVQTPLPDGFNAADLSVMPNDEATNFLVEYWGGLREAEGSFRESRKRGTPESPASVGPMGGTTETPS